MNQRSMAPSPAAGAGRKLCQKAAFSDHSTFPSGIPGDTNCGVVFQSGSCEPKQVCAIRPISEVYLTFNALQIKTPALLTGLGFSSQ